MSKRKRKRAAPRHRRATGTGALFWHAKRRVYVYRLAFGRKPNGKPLYVERSDPVLSEVIRKMDGAKPPGPETTVAEFARRWLAEMECRPNTRANRTNTIERFVVPALGGVRLADLTPHQIERAAAGWVEGGAHPNTVRGMLGHLQTCLRECVRQQLRTDNPAQVARKPKTVQKDTVLFTPAELARVVAAATARRGARVWALVAATGMRSGEAFALDVGDFDPSAKTVRITRTYSQRGMGPPKSVHSVRTIRVPAAALPAVVAAIGKRTSGPLFVSERGRRYVLPLARKAWNWLLKGLELAPRVPHTLRHSVATALNGAGVPVGDAAKYIGDSVKTYVATYLHATGADACAALDGVFAASPASERP